MLFLLSKLIIIHVRVSSILYVIFFGKSLINKNIIFFLSILISILLNPFIFCKNIILFSIHGILILIKQIFIGFFIGLIINYILYFVNFAGDIISYIIGISCCVSFDFIFLRNNFIFSKILNNLFLLIFLSCNGHLWIIYIIAESFNYISIDYNLKFSYLFMLYLNIIKKVFISGIILSFPIVMIIFIVIFLMSFLNKLSYSVFTISINFPINILLSIWIFYFFYSIFEDCIKHTLYDLLVSLLLVC